MADSTGAMTKTAVSDTPSGMRLVGSPVEPRLGLSELDKLAAGALATGDISNMLEQVRARAEALCSDDGDGAIRRVIARRLASTEAAVELLEAMVGRCIAARDFDALMHVERLLKSYSARLIRLVEAHALTMRLSERTPIVVERVRIEAP